VDLRNARLWEILCFAGVSCNGHVH
jgi:hypothetical protein